MQRTKEVQNSQVSSDSTESPTIAKIRNINTDMDMETDEQVFIKSPHLEIVAPWLAYRREGVYYFAYHEAYADVAFIALLEQEEMMLYSYRGKHIKRAPKREYYIPGQKPPTYVWGQQIKNRPGGEDFSGLPMPDWMVSLKNKINCDFNCRGIRGRSPARLLGRRRSGWRAAERRGDGGRRHHSPIAIGPKHEAAHLLHRRGKLQEQRSALRRPFLSARVGDVELAERRVGDLLFDERRERERHILAVFRIAGVAFRLLQGLLHLLEHLRGAASQVRHGVGCFVEQLLSKRLFCPLGAGP